MDAKIERQNEAAHWFKKASPRSRVMLPRLVSVSLFAYAGVMFATAVVEGKVVRFKLSPALTRAHRQNRGKTLTEGEAVAFVEAKRRARALRRARPYLASRS
jgi:ribosomal protein S19